MENTLTDGERDILAEIEKDAREARDEDEEGEAPQEILHPGCGGPSVEVRSMNPYTNSNEIVLGKRWCMRCDNYFTA